MTYSATVGSGGTHADLNAFTTFVAANHVSGGNLTQDVEALITAGGIITSTKQIVSGWNPNGFTTTIKPNTGAGFADHANVRTTNALIYNESNGAFIRSTYSGGDPAVSIRVDKSRVTGLQFRTNNNAQALSFDTGTITDLVAAGNIVWAEFSANGALVTGSTVDGTSVYIYNNVVRSDRGAGGASPIFINGCTTFNNRARVWFNTMWQAVGGNSDLKVDSNAYIETINNVMLQITTCAISARDAQTNGGYNSTSRSAWDNTGYGAGTITGLTNSQFSITTANEFVGAGATPTDFKLKSGGTACQANGQTLSVTVDITGFARPAGSEDRGAYQLTGGGGGGGSKPRPMSLLGVG